MQYIVFYTENCSPKVEYFNTLRSAKLFCTKFLKKHKLSAYKNEGYTGHWIDCIIHGEIEVTYPGWFGISDE
jgi:hypothetical protein